MKNNNKQKTIKSGSLKGALYTCGKAAYVSSVNTSEEQAKIRAEREMMESSHRLSDAEYFYTQSLQAFDGAGANLSSALGSLAEAGFKSADEACPDQKPSLAKEKVAVKAAELELEIAKQEYAKAERRYVRRTRECMQAILLTLK